MAKKKLSSTQYWALKKLYNGETLEDVRPNTIESLKRMKLIKGNNPKFTAFGKKFKPAL